MSSDSKELLIIGLMIGGGYLLYQRMQPGTTATTQNAFWQGAQPGGYPPMAGTYPQGTTSSDKAAYTKIAYDFFKGVISSSGEGQNEGSYDSSWTETVDEYYGTLV